MKSHLAYYKTRFNDTYTKLVISYILVAIIITIILSIILFSVFQRTSIQVIEADSKGRLSQNVNHLNLIRSRVFSLGQQMLNDSDIINAIYSEEVASITDKAHLMRKLQNVIDSDSIIHSVVLYNAKNHDINDTFGVEGKDAYTKRMLELLKSFDIYSKAQFLPSKISYKKVNGDISKDNIITVIFSPIEYSNEQSKTNASGFPNNSAILINLNAEMIQGSIASGLGDQISETIIIDKKGNVIFDSSSENFGDNIIEKRYVKDILASNKQDDSITEQINGKKSLVVYKNIGTPEWTFINIYKYENLFKDINKLGIIIIFVCVGVLIAAIAFSIITAKTIYSPFKGLLRSAKNALKTMENEDSINNTEGLGDIQYLTHSFNYMIKRANELESSVNHSIPTLKKAYLKKMILGKYNLEPKFLQYLEVLFKALKLNNNKGCFCVLVFSLDEYKVLINKGNFQSDDIMFSSMEMLITEQISEAFLCEPIDNEDGYIYLLIRIEDESHLSMKSKRAINEIQQNIQESLGCKISCAVGIPVNSIGDIHLSYSNAIDIIKYHMVYGYGSFFSYDMAELAEKLPPVSIDKGKDKLLHNIKLCDIPGTEKEIDNIINDISECQYDYIMLILNQLMLDIVKSVQSFFEADSNELNFNNIYSNLNSIGTLDEMKSFFMIYCRAAIEKIEMKKANRKSEVISDIINYINKNYQSYEISTESLAEMANLTPGYFGKLFNEYTGKSVNEYIVNLRLEKAKELLSSTNSSINDISGKVGFNNSTYFMTVFKKSFGMTPNQYRTENRMGK